MADDEYRMLLEAFDASDLAANDLAANDSTAAASDSTAVARGPAANDLAAGDLAANDPTAGAGDLAANDPTAGARSPAANDLAANDREDLVIIAKMRRISRTVPQLWGIPIEVLQAEVAAAASAPGEAAAIAAAIEFRSHKTRETKTALEAELRRLGGKISSKMTKVGVIDAIAEAMAEARPPAAIVELDEDQRAIVEKRGARRLYVNAGPGAGKTTTLAHLVAAAVADNPDARVLVLAYNVVAEAAATAALKSLRVPRIAKTRAADSSAKGVAVLTFDKFGYQVTAAAQDDEWGEEPARADCYRVALERASAQLRREIAKSPGLGDWDLVVVDEAQDVLPVHAAIIAGLVDRPNSGSRLIAAGDPRQEVYAGATWFSGAWTSAPEAERAVIRTNHRAAPEIVAALNAFGRANFPQLHVDQIAARPAGGRVEIVEAPAPPMWDRRANAAHDLGEVVGGLAAEGRAGATYALAPVTTAKYGLGSATLAARQVVAERRPGTFVACGPSAGADYVFATSRAVKGTERSRVVVYGADLGYELSIDALALAKLVFVAISRARDELVLVVRPGLQPRAGAIISPIAGAGRAVRAAVAVAREKQKKATISVATGPDENDLAGISGHSALPARILRSFRGGALGLVARGDADFVGVLAETAVAHALGVDTDLNIKIVAEPNPHRRGLFPGQLRVEPHACDAIAAHFADSSARAAYRHASLLFAAAAGRPWTTSDRFATQDIDARAAADSVRAFAPGTPQHRCRKAQQTRPDRSAANSVEIRYELDLVFPGVVVELKHTHELTAAHRRQTAVYAALEAIPSAVLYNLADGSIEVIAAARLDDVSRVARAVVAIRGARARAIGALAGTGIAATTRECVISVDTETGGSSLGAPPLTEIGALAFLRTTGEIIGVYHEIAPGVAASGASGARAPGARARSFPGSPAAIEELTALRVIDAELATAAAETLRHNFREWVENLSGSRSFVHWGGSEAALVAGLGETIDVRERIFRPWLGTQARQGQTTLGDAAAQLLPGQEFAFHRAFEDALATAAVFVAASK